MTAKLDSTATNIRFWASGADVRNINYVQALAYVQADEYSRAFDYSMKIQL